MPQNPNRVKEQEEQQQVVRNYEQINGQRIYTPYPELSDFEPPKGCEVFVGRIPHKTDGNQLFNIFKHFGKIYKIRTMLDFYGRNRGFAFVTYFTRESALLAVKHLNNSLIDKNVIVVNISVDNRRLFLGNLPTSITENELKDSLTGLVEGVKDIITYVNPVAPLLNRGFAFVEFENHACAVLARRNLSMGNLVLWNKSITVDWAAPQPELTPEIISKLKRLYISNVPVLYDRNDLLNALITTGNISFRVITRFHKHGSYAFAHFLTNKDATDAMMKLKDLVIEGHKIRVEWARPLELRSAMPLNAYCRSVPPRMRKILHEMKKIKLAEANSSFVSTFSNSPENVPYFCPNLLFYPQSISPVFTPIW